MYFDFFSMRFLESVYLGMGMKSRVGSRFERVRMVNGRIVLCLDDLGLVIMREKLKGDGTGLYTVYKKRGIRN